ncbi:hypothetical protein D4764_07G0007210 [Takifugu flavidus]|uniref:Uncharacterized protein n=1 Tax=Takifugu flavidus TaxID=433684 RepID=A0A5C6MRX2_9TELE|nr:hypothetical protein D4764_07G0007210 [Takifugu flavidus]
MLVCSLQPGKQQVEVKTIEECSQQCDMFTDLSLSFGSCGSSLVAGGTAGARTADLDPHRGSCPSFPLSLLLFPTSSSLLFLGPSWVYVF